MQNPKRILHQINGVKCAERRTQKKIPSFEMGIEHMTFQTLVRCSNHSATGNYSDKQVNIIWADKMMSNELGNQSRIFL